MRCYDILNVNHSRFKSALQNSILRLYIRYDVTHIAFYMYNNMGGHSSRGSHRALSTTFLHISPLGPLMQYSVLPLSLVVFVHSTSSCTHPKYPCLVSKLLSLYTLTPWSPYRHLPSIRIPCPISPP